MKKFTRTLLVALAIIISGNLPVLAITGTYHLHGGYEQTFDQFVNRGHVDIIISGDGSSDLDLYVWVGDSLYKSESNSDDEKVCLSIRRSGNIRIKVVNRGYYANNYELKIK